MNDHWEDWPEGDEPDTMTWILFAAGIIAIVITAWWYAMGIEIDLSEFKSAAEVISDAKLSR